MWLGCEQLDRVRHEAAPSAASASHHLPVTAKSHSRHGVATRKKALLTVFEVGVTLPERLGATDVDLHIASGM